MNTPVSTLAILPIPAFRDNYIWALYRVGADGQPETGDCWVVDPGEAEPVERFLESRQLRLAGILVTHHHPDHIGGVGPLTGKRKLPVVGNAAAHIGSITDPCEDGEEYTILGIPFRMLTVPGHTLDHVAWVGDVDGCPMLFCGDTLFSAGCGRLFEGTAEQMLHSLNRLAALPGQTRVYCAHEYTLSNLRFAAAVLGPITPVTVRQQECAQLLNEGRPTLPAVLDAERQYNPFLMTDDPRVRQAVTARVGSQEKAPQGAVEIFAALRRWKDQF